LNKLSELHFDNRFLRDLPADPNPENYPRQVFQALYSHVNPKVFANPELIAASEDVAALLDLSSSVVQSKEFANIFSGSQLLPGMEPHSTCYGGHQFGNWAGQLGDGRAINLGEVKNHHNEYWTLQLKGAGPTPYSRTADGFAVLRSSVREFLCSEAMFYLGIPTTRALSLVATGEQVRRDMFYDGNPQLEPGAVVCRVAPSFTRFGHFEILSARQDVNLLKQLTDITIRHHFTHLLPNPTAVIDQQIYLEFFIEVCKTTAVMIAHWMRVGFVHGVMNTDNMSILGLTIDYGPYGWLENVDPDWTPNTTDAQGKRYRFANQPQVALWNLAQLANALYPLIPDVDLLQSALDEYRKTYTDLSKQHQSHKIGFTKQADNQDELLSRLQKLLQGTDADMTIFYRLLANYSVDNLLSEDNTKKLSEITDTFYQPLNDQQKQDWLDWLREYGKLLQADYIIHGVDDKNRKENMNAINPKYVLRNYMAQVAIDQATQGDYSEIHRLMELLKKPYDEQPEFQQYFAKRPDWAKHKAGCSMLSCSS
jgi:serine/tyrosine/threonine adenylyltransferase